MTRYPSGHVVRPASGIRCPCGAPATRCETVWWETAHVAGASGYYYCDRCWIVAGPDGRSPRDHAHDPRPASASSP